MQLYNSSSFHALQFRYVDLVDTAVSGYLKRCVFVTYQAVEAALVGTVTEREASHRVLRQGPNSETYSLTKIKATLPLPTHRGELVSRPIELLFSYDGK